MQTFAVIIPTRNEASDIANTLKAVGNQTHRAKEILVIDDSTDKTPDIVTEVSETFSNIRLVKGVGKGRCGARNMGIQICSADVVVLLNADVIVPEDFLERLKTHYEKGADYVLVGWEVANPDSVRARYIQAESHLVYRLDSSIEWTEGFSCRKEIAVRAGLFPETLVPLLAGEDGVFGLRLRALGKKVVDRSIIVRFVVPVDPMSFFRTYKERAYPHTLFFVYKKSFGTIIVRTLCKQILRLLKLATIIFPVFLTGQMIRMSPKGLKDWLPFLLIFVQMNLIYSFGEWEGLVRLGIQLKMLRTNKVNDYALVK